MTAIVTAADGRLYQHVTAPREAVFVADMPRITSNPRATPHTGLALLLGYLDPVQPGGERLARLRLPNGRLVEMRASAICPATNLATRRLGPAPIDLRRLG